MSNLLNFCRMTSSTGGTGALTCTAQTGYPDIAEAITGTRFVNYSINEYTNSLKTQLSKAESGIGSYVASTGVLTRTSVKATWDGTDYLPKFGTATAPTALSFGTTNANIDIIVGPTADHANLTIPFVAGAVAGMSDGLGTAGLNSVTPMDYIFSAGFTFYTPVLLLHSGPFSQASIRTTNAAVTAGAGAPSTASAAIYEVGNNGLPGKLLVDFGNMGRLTSLSTNYTSAPLAVPVYLAPGWYWQAILLVLNSDTGTPQIAGSSSLLSGSPRGSLNAGFGSLRTAGGDTVFSDPAAAPTTNGGVSYGIVLFK